MRNKMTFFIATTSVFVGLTLPTFAQTAMQTVDTTKAPVSQNAPITAGEERQAMRMVAAAVSLDDTLDANKIAAGYQFKTTLATTVHLDGGVDLPKNTKLIGEVSKDDLNLEGNSKLALRFTQAVLKNGTIIPIRATIVAAYPPEEPSFSEATSAPGKQMPNDWNDKTLTIDQVGVMKDVDLHSRISSHNSGVFVSGGNHIVKLIANSELALAISARGPVAQ